MKYCVNSSHEKFQRNEQLELLKDNTLRSTTICVSSKNFKTDNMHQKLQRKCRLISSWLYSNA